LKAGTMEHALFLDISTIYAKKFYGLAPSLFEQNKMKVKNTGVLILSELDFSMVPTEEATFVIW